MYTFTNIEPGRDFSVFERFMRKSNRFVSFYSYPPLEPMLTYSALGLSSLLKISMPSSSYIPIPVEVDAIF